MKNKVFDVVYSDYDSMSHHYLIGPNDIDKEQFDKLCERLLPEAGYQTFLKHSRSVERTWIYWGDVVESLVSLLEKQGYQRISLDTYKLHADFESIVGADNTSTYDKMGFSGHMIGTHNYKIEQKQKEELKATRKSLKKKPIQIIK